jgi:putative membrane protein
VRGLATAETKGSGHQPGASRRQKRSQRGAIAIRDGRDEGRRLEVQRGKLAEEKASNPAKQFGQRMVQDHGKANQEAHAAQSKGVAVSTQPDGKHERMQQRLSKLSGADFDRAYVKEMVPDHEKDVKEFRRMSQQAKDPQLKAWTAQSLLKLEEHLRMVKYLQRHVSHATAKLPTATR